MYDNDKLSELGVDIEDGLKRFMGKQSIFEKMLKKLPKAFEDNKVMPYFESNDLAKALEKAHTLKGVTGNLSALKLYEAYSEIVALLRANEPDKAKELLEETIPMQEKLIAYLKENE